MTDNMMLLPKDTEKLLIKLIEYNHSCNDEVVYAYLVDQLQEDDPYFQDRINTLTKAGYLRADSSYHLTDTGIAYLEIKRKYSLYVYWKPAKVSFAVSIVINLLMELIRNGSILLQRLQSMLE